MSRIGLQPITVPSGVTVKVDESTNEVVVTGPKGELRQGISRLLTVKQEGSTLSLSRPNNLREARSQHGLARTLIANMVDGVTKGFSRGLEIVGVGYRAQMQGKKLALQLGYSHPVVIEPPAGITIAVEGTNKISVSGPDKQQVGQVAAQIRDVRPPEPYKGKGIRYEGEYVRRKLGKAGKTAGKK